MRSTGYILAPYSPHARSPYAPRACCSACERGSHLGEVEDFGEADDSEKLQKIAAATAAGAAVGTAIPIPVVGTAVGAAAGAVVGAITQYGDKLKSLFGGHQKGEAEYEEERRKCRATGGQPVPGVPPDNYGGCRYPDGSVSGGDWPFPGSWNGEIRDQAVFDRWKAAVAPKTAAAPLHAPMPRVQSRPAPTRRVEARTTRTFAPSPMRSPMRAMRENAPTEPEPEATHSAAVPIAIGAVIAAAAAGGGAWWWMRAKREADDQ